ncbi:ankyrin repeat-containing domain protein [Podospora fimiseda]|uniref:Ankyrin repeat-containing domain protein n=1 Tax=Podospora fimiseda TaxID=252190 RepID=A0AAN7GZQ0_9PEZI|nr:ankyrin repeat-containing domain protein [Podospora fimiseda]
MSDPLSVASGVAGFLSLGLTVCKGLISYYESWKDADSEIKTTLDSIQDLDRILSLLESTLMKNDKVNEKARLQTFQTLASCSRGIVTLEKKLQKIQGHNSGSQWQRTLYPFKKSTLAKLQEIVDDLRGNLQLAVEVLGIDLSLHHFASITGQLSALSVGVENVQSSLDMLKAYHDSEEMRSFYRWLSPLLSTFEERHHAVFGLTGRQDGTWEWLKGTKEFNSWLDGTEKVLWCPGLPGVGKTVLASSIINHLDKNIKRPNIIGVGFVYCDFGNVLLTVSNIIASLLRQFCMQMSAVPQQLLDLYKDKGLLGIQMNLREYTNALHKVVNQFSEVYLVVDGLDECPSREVDDVCGQLVEQLMALPSNVHLLVTSRDLPNIQELFSNNLRLEIQASLQAIEGYLAERVDASTNLRRHIKRKPDLRERIIRSITQNAEGMFLLARMQIDLIATQLVLGRLEITLKNLRQNMNDLDKAYDNVMMRITSQDTEKIDIATQVLTWLFYAKQPMKLQDLRYAIAVNIAKQVDPEGSTLDTDFLPNGEDLTSVCAGIVTYHKESDTVVFVHYTIKEYLIRLAERTEGSLSHLLLPETHITQICLRYLCLQYEMTESLILRWSCIRRGPLRHSFFKRVADTKYPLLYYAARYWAEHARTSWDEPTEALVMLAQSQPFFARVCFMVRELEMDDFAVAVKRSCGNDPDARNAVCHFPPSNLEDSLLLLAVFHRMEDLVRLLVTKKNRNFTIRKDETPVAISLAAGDGCSAILQLLLDSQVGLCDGGKFLDLDDNGEGILYQAASYGHTEALQILFKYGARGSSNLVHTAAAGNNQKALDLILDSGFFNVNGKNRKGETPLWMAAKRAQAEAAELLIKRGADMSVKCCKDTPFAIAARHGLTAVLQVLLDHGANPEAEAINGMVHDFKGYLFWRDRTDSIKWLLDNQFLTSMTCEYVKTTLACASKLGSTSIARLLIEKGADVNSQSRSYLPPLFYAGTGAMAQILLDAGADIHAKKNKHRDKQTPLHMAVQQGRVDVVRVLLENGADPTVRDSAGKTAFQHDWILQEDNKRVEMERIIDDWKARHPSVQNSVCGELEFSGLKSWASFSHGEGPPLFRRRK